MLVGMCMRCEGADDDDVRFAIHANILRYGWHVTAVVADRVSRSWAYTIGLAGLGHPEFSVVGQEAEDACVLVNALGESVRAGRRFEAGETVVVSGVRWLIGEVHPFHYEAGTFVEWDDYYRALGPPHPEAKVLEVIPEGACARLASPVDMHSS
jgi:Domain of unknown function (DUF4262)